MTWHPFTRGKTRLRTLHVAALPFPSPQGTQGLLHQMLRALSERGHETHLLCYPYGARDPSSTARSDAEGPRASTARPHADQPCASSRAAQPDTRYVVHRVPIRSFARSLRSGPSLDKLWLDVGLARELVRLSSSLAPDLIVAHHVEAAACALSLRTQRSLFVAHTSLSEELPTYAPLVLAPFARHLGSAFDTYLARQSARTLAVSPTLAALLSAQSRSDVGVLPLPWPLAVPSTDEESSAARAALGLLPEHELLLYAGNLDAYQGLSALLPAIALLAGQRPALRWLIATESSRRALRRALREHGLLGRTTFAPLGDEPARRLVHAAADCALVPRLSAGGVPVKLLDAVARGVPTVASRTALAGYPLDDACSIVDEQTPACWAKAISQVLEQRAQAHQRADSARGYLAREHGPARFVGALEQHARELSRA